MNACLRAIVRTASFRGCEVVGIRNGFQGLIDGNAVPLHLGSVGNIIQRGGTFLGSSRSDEFRSKSGRKKAFDFMATHRMTSLICLGGDGTFKGAEAFSQEFGVRVVGIPSTIDNDLPGTEACIGFDTAVNNAVQAIDKIRDTADSHGRVFVIEVMGRNTGHLALATGLAVGAEFVVIPEVRLSLPNLVKKIQTGIARGKTGSIVIVAEAEEPGRAFKISSTISRSIRRDVRTVILGHLQRGGSPTAMDRNLASRLGAGAVEILIKGGNRQMVGIKNDSIVSSKLNVTSKGRRKASLDLLELINILSI